MRTVGRGRDYSKALLLNLTRNLVERKNITTTEHRARMLKRKMGKKGGGTVQITPLHTRRGDNTLLYRVEWQKEELHADKIDKAKRNTKKVASR